MEQARQQAFEMKDELILGFQAIEGKIYYDDAGKQKRPRNNAFTPVWVSEPEGKEWLSKVDEFFEHLANGLKDTATPFEDIRDEVRIILRTVNKDGEPATVDIETCSKEAFVIHVMRYCIKDAKLQMQYATNWKYFAKEFSKYVMNAI